jgi:hypothetical protein
LVMGAERDSQSYNALRDAYTPMDQSTEDSVRPLLGLHHSHLSRSSSSVGTPSAGTAIPTTRNKSLPQGTSNAGLCWCGERSTIIAVLCVLRTRCSVAGISWDAGFDGEVLSMPPAIVMRVGKRVTIIPGKTSPFGRNLRIY